MEPLVSGRDSVTRRSDPISIRVVNLCMCVDLSCGTVVRMMRVASGLNQCMVKSVWSSASTVVLEWKQMVGS